MSKVLGYCNDEKIDDRFSNLTAVGILGALGKRIRLG